MKIFLVIFLLFDILLVAAAAVRITTATPETKPFVQLGGSLGDNSGSFVGAADPESKRAGANEADAFMSATDPDAGKDPSVEAQLGNAIKKEEGREQDLMDAKKEIGKIGK